jgi:hypothetical protein
VSDAKVIDANILSFSEGCGLSQDSNGKDSDRILGFSNRGFGHVGLGELFHSDFSELRLALPLVVSVVRLFQKDWPGNQVGLVPTFFVFRGDACLAAVGLKASCFCLFCNFVPNDCFAGLLAA